ncbi:MAG: hypothetical protein CM1200mP21_00960 [Candidatus Poseidoniales archaeon]|nr:MAG: hypothetical protein CM1200mP21_00960 [Candidatus Poseidoniales archaeon]
MHERLPRGESSIGSARVVRGGKDLTIVTWGAMVHVALKAALEASKKGFEVEIVDLRTISPFDDRLSLIWDWEKEILVLQGGPMDRWAGKNVSSRILEGGFWCLEGAPRGMGGPWETPFLFLPLWRKPSNPILGIRHMRECALNNTGPNPKVMKGFFSAAYGRPP